MVVRYGFYFVGSDAERQAYSAEGLWNGALWASTDTQDLWIYIASGPSWTKCGMGTGGGGAPTDATYVTFSASGGLSAEKLLGTDVIMLGAVASRPAASVAGRLYFVTDAGSQRWTRDNGTSWDDVVIHWNQVSGKPASFAPSAHASTHQSAGSDAIKLDDLAAPDDNTDLDTSTSKHGLMPKLPGGTTNFYRADGTFAAPPAGGEAFPVGAVFMAVVSTNPATLLGYGTWSQIAGGRVLVGQTSGDADFDVAEETGGAKTKTLQTTEIPSHTHPITDPGHAHTTQRYPTTTGGSSGFTADTSMSGTPADNTLATKSASTGISATDAAGGGQAFSLMNPYLVVYIWKRTA